jgi:hypothetical protein
MESMREGNWFRLVSAGVLPSARTFTRTFSAGPGSLGGFRRGRRGPREGCEAKVFSAVLAEHDSVGHLLESRCAAATSEVLEALRHGLSRSIEEAYVIEGEVLAGSSAPFDSFLSVHGKLGNSHSLIYTRLEDLAATVREYCRLGPAPLVFIREGNQRARSTHLGARLLSGGSPTASINANTSDCLPDVLPQPTDYIAFIEECPRIVRVTQRG